VSVAISAGQSSLFPSGLQAKARRARPIKSRAVALELVLRARHCLSLGRLDEAEALARRAAEDQTHAADALHLVGLVDLRRGRPDAAERALRQAIERDGRVAAYHNDLGNALQDRGRLNEAIAAYRRALRLHPALAEAWNDLGTARFAQGELEPAIECYQRALRLRPDHIVAHANLGAVYRKLGLLGDARRALQRELILRLKQGLRSLWSRRLDLGSAQQLCALAQAQLDAGNPRHGMAIARRALECEAQHAEALCLISAAHLRLGASGPALEAALRAQQAKPRAARVQQQLGASFAAAGRLEEAAAAFEEALALQPAAETLAALGELRLRRGDAPGAETLLRQALERRPHDALLHTALGEARHRQRGFDEAQAAYRRALELDPQHLAAYVRLSESLRETERLDEAEAVARAAVALDDESAAAHVVLGAALKSRGRLKKAIESFERALQLNPRQLQGLQQLALALREDDRMEEAEQHLRAALRVRPDEPLPLADLGMILADQMRYREALELFDRALKAAPQFVVALNRKALLLDHLGDRTQSMQLLREAVRLAPDDSYAQYNIGLHHLKYGDYAPGWDGYEQRRSFDSFVGRYRRFALPEWDREPLAGRVLLVLPEQGLGDEIMFGSCLPDVAAQARHVIVECDQKLEAIFRRSFADCTVVSRQRTLENDWINRITPKPELLAAAGSLARRFRRNPTDFPQRAFLQADAAAVAAWKAKLDALGPGPKVGLSWRGGTGFTGKKRRSFLLEDLLPLLRLPGLRFVNLQYTDVREEMRALEQRHSIKVHHWQQAIDDYDQTAALVCALDGVVTVCTAIVHLSGALGRPALVMVPFGADWRYGASGERMVWYPSVRLVRQRNVGEWADVLQEVSRRLQAGAWQ
jgi:tetratricopeptide (TPR) repeat protein